jgi:acylphosphatase
MIKAVRLKIHGRVQGVFFRHRTQKLATRLRLSGWVRNAPDGTVEILAQGEEKDLENLIRWCHRGPLLSRVEKVEVKVQNQLEPLTGFKITD